MIRVSASVHESFLHVNRFCTTVKNTSKKRTGIVHQCAHKSLHLKAIHRRAEWTMLCVIDRAEPRGMKERRGEGGWRPGMNFKK